MDTLTAVSVCAIAFGAVAMISVRLVQHMRLDTTTWILLNQFRFAQTLAATSATSGAVWLDPFDTRYHLSYGTSTLARYQFPSGIDYVDGYLQLNNSRISYDNFGNAQVAGQVRLTDGVNERDIHLYMGVGLQSAGWLTR